MLAVTVLAACKQNPDTTEQAIPQQEAEAAVQTATTVVEEEPVAEPAKVQQESYFDRKAATQRTTTQREATTQRNNAKAETIYVEADDSHGRVWGHVTMKGDRGTGTIHDEGENTWAVTVTRHGNELYAVDQNSRQYVFKLKQNKTQE